MAAMAVTVSGAFVSCHDDEITPTTFDQKKLAFEDAFISYYGQPDPNHTWGFGNDEENVTRSVDVNGNLWESCPSLAEGEAQAIHDWVNKPKSEIPTESYYEVSPVDLKNFFVTQVWGQNENTDDENCQYTDYDGGSVFGSSKMNHLQISKSAERLGTDGVASVNVNNANPGGDAINSNWDHANNFNAASNQDWNGNTMFVNWGTQNFAYHNSNDSRYHDKWIIVDGYYITTDHRFAGKYYVCFDFISRDPNVYTNFQDANGQNYEVSGAWKSTADAVAAGAKARINGQWDGSKMVYEEGPAVGSDWTKGNIAGPSGGGNRIVDANEYYTDWIIRLVEANSKIPKVKITTSTGKIRKEVFIQTTAIKGGRVMCEDIASASYSRKDFDYNDVVFDAIIYQNKYVLVTYTLDNSGTVLKTSDPEPNYTQEDGMPDPNWTSHHANIRLMAAGGTLPLQIIANGHNFEVHNLLGNKPTNVMINTLHKNERNVVNGAEVDSNAPVDLTVDGSKDIEGITNLQDIQIAVKYSQSLAGMINAEKGKASAKILAPLGTRWAKERTDISTVYTHFSDWVKDEDATGNSVWYTDVNSTDLYDNLEGLSMPTRPSISSSSVWKYEYSSGSTTTSTDAKYYVMATPAGTMIYDYNTKGAGFLYDGSTVNATSTASITAGSKIRVYGVSIDNWEVTCNNQTKSQSTESGYATNGYVEFDVTQDLGTSLAITGKNFTITYITVVGATPAAKPGQFWPENGGNGNATSQFNISASVVSTALNSATTKTKICIYCTIGTGSWLKLNRGSNWPAWTADDVTGWKIGNNTSELEPTDGQLTSVYNSTKGCVEVPLTTKFISDITSENAGLGLNFGNGNMTVTNITIE